MKVVILAGGMGTRLAEETVVRPKPMVDIGGKPILWHIMKHYAHYSFNDFVIALGYKSEYIKRYFHDYYYCMNGDITISLSNGKVEVHDGAAEDWVINLVETGLMTNTGGRVKRIERWVEGKTFMLTYGDGVCNVDLEKLLAFHRAHGKLATVTAVRPPARFGSLSFDGDLVTEFVEKPLTGEGWINGGFFVLEPGVFDYIPGDVAWEQEPLRRIAQDGQMVAFRHDDFWQCMDTYRDLKILEGYWSSGEAPWKVW